MLSGAFNCAITVEQIPASHWAVSASGEPVRLRFSVVSVEFLASGSCLYCAQKFSTDMDACEKYKTYPVTLRRTNSILLRSA